MSPMPAPTSSAPSPRAASVAASGLCNGVLRRVGRALPLLAALLAVPSIAAAQDFPDDAAGDIPVTTGETGASQPAELQPGEDAADASVTLVADTYADTDPSALTEFQQPLTPYGSWVDDPTYGTVWVPSAIVVGADFAPYQTNGHWSLTDDGDWIWVSDYAWGHIPFHYGRWVWISANGWAWIPGRVYAPAWVVWRVGESGYVGWAPMPPAYSWNNGVAVTLWTAPPAAFVFCPTTYVFHRHVHTYIVRDRTIVRSIASHSHTYRPARPTATAPGRPSARSASTGAPGSHAIHPGGYSGSRPGYRPASPSLAEVGVPASSAPKLRAAPDPRSLAYARKSTTASARAMPIPARILNASPAPARAAARPTEPWVRGPGTGDGGGHPQAHRALGQPAPTAASGRFPVTTAAPGRFPEPAAAPGRFPEPAAAPGRLPATASPNDPRLNAPRRARHPIPAPHPGPPPQLAPAPRAASVKRTSPSPQTLSETRSISQPRVSAPVVKSHATPSFSVPTHARPATPSAPAPHAAPAPRRSMVRTR